MTVESTRRTYGVGLVALVVVLAGCSGRTAADARVVNAAIACVESSDARCASNLFHLIIGQ